MRCTHFLQAKNHAPVALRADGRLFTLPRMVSYDDKLAALGRSVKMHRKAAGISQEQLGLAIDLDQSNLSRFEKGKQGVSLEILVAIAEKLGVPLHLLFEEAERITGEAISKKAIRVARKWQNAPPHEREALAILVGATPPPTRRNGTDG